PATGDHLQAETRLRHAVRRLAAAARTAAHYGRRRASLARFARCDSSRLSAATHFRAPIGTCRLLRHDGLGADDSGAVVTSIAGRGHPRRYSVILRLVTALASGVGKHAKLSAFYFHRVVSEPDPLLPGEPDARQFDAILGWIGAQFRVLDPVEACNRLFSGSLPSRAAIMSFDDGYVDNFDVALPILQRHRMKAAFFVASGYLNGGLMFNDRIIEAIRQTTATAIAGDAYGGGTIDLPLRSNHERRVGIERILDSIKHLPPTKRDEHVERVEHALGARGL